MSKIEALIDHCGLCVSYHLCAISESLVLLKSFIINMPVEALEDEGLSRNPNIETAEVFYVLHNKSSTDLEKENAKKTLMKEIIENSKYNPLVLKLAHEKMIMPQSHKKEPVKLFHNLSNCASGCGNICINIGSGK